MMTLPFFSSKQFQELSQSQQWMSLRKRFQVLLEKQKQVNAVLTTVKNYDKMWSPYDNANPLNKMVRKYARVYLNPRMSLKCPGTSEIFTITRLDKLCTDTTKLIQQFLCTGKPSYALLGLMYVTGELFKEQQRIINKYKTDYDWRKLLPGVDLTLQPSEKEW